MPSNKNSATNDFHTEIFCQLLGGGGMERKLHRYFKCLFVPGAGRLFYTGNLTSSVPGSGCFQIFHGNVPKIQGWLAFKKVSSLPAMQELGFVLHCKNQHPFLNTNLHCKTLETLPWNLWNMLLWWIRRWSKLIVYNAKNLCSSVPTFLIYWFRFHSLSFALV